MTKAKMKTKMKKSMKNTKKKKIQHGFTLVELLVVVAILGILAAIAIPQYEGYQQQAKINAVRSNHTALVSFLAGEFAKCSAGATELFEGGASCDLTVDDIDAMEAGIVAFAADDGSGNLRYENPYTPTVAAVVAGAPAGVAGSTYVESDGVDTLTIVSQYTDATGAVIDIQDTVVRE